MICDYSNFCTSAVPFLKRKLTEEVPMRLTRYLNCTPSRLFSKYSEMVSLGVLIPKNLNVIKPLPRHRLGMKNKKAITEEGVSQKWLSVKEVCGFLGISKSTFYKWQQIGRAPEIRRLPNGDLRIREDWLGAFLANLPEGSC